MKSKEVIHFIIPAETTPHDTSVSIYHAHLKSDEESYEVKFKLGRQIASTEYPIDVVKSNLEKQKWIEVPVNDSTS